MARIRKADDGFRNERSLPAPHEERGYRPPCAEESGRPLGAYQIMDQTRSKGVSAGSTGRWRDWPDCGSSIASRPSTPTSANTVRMRRTSRSPSAHAVGVDELSLGTMSQVALSAKKIGFALHSAIQAFRICRTCRNELEQENIARLLSLRSSISRIGPGTTSSSTRRSGRRCT